MIGAPLPLRAASQPNLVSIVTPNEDEFLLCTFYIDRELLSEDLVTYSTDRGLFLPLGGICRLIECGLDVDPGLGTASGGLWDEAHTFSLDMASRSVRVAGKSAVYDEARIEAHPDDIYVEASLLSRWLGIPLQADRYDATVVLRPQTKLPIQLRLERERRGGGSYDAKTQQYFPRAMNPYRFLDGLSVDFSVASSASFSEGAVSAAKPTYSALLTGDLLWMSGSLAVTGKLDGSDFLPTSLYGVLRRMDPDGSLFGPLHATEFSLGKISAVLPSLTGASASGYGIVIGNYSLTSPSYFDLQTLMGPLLPGWDVELYQNDSYLDYRKADASGIYTFADIPLVFGTNVLRLEFHGPLGQKKSEEHVYSVGSNMTPPGTFSYRASATLEDKGPQFALQSTYGLSKYLTATASALSGAFSDGRGFHTQAGLAGYFSHLQFDASAAYDARHSGLAGDLGLRLQIFGIGVSWRGTYYDQSWERANASCTDPPYLARGSFRVDNIHWTIGKVHSTLSPSSTCTIYLDGDKYDVFKLQLYNSYKRLYLRHTLLLNHYEYSSAASELEAEGSSTVGWCIGKARLACSFDYRLLPGAGVDSLSAEVSSDLTSGIQLSGSVNFHPSLNLFSGAASASWNLGICRFGLTGALSSSGSVLVSATLSTSIAIDPHRSMVSCDSTKSAGQGSVSARVYLDTNYNKKWDEGERALEGVGFVVNESRNEAMTDAKGCVFLRGLPSNVPVNLSIAEESLEDFNFIPADKGVSCVLHPGTAARLDFPIWLTGEISGTVWAVEGGVRRELAGARVELLDSSGTVMGSVRSAYDGYYVFSALKVGPYMVRIKKKNTDGKVAYITRVVNIPQNGGYVDGADLEYRPFDDTSETGAGGCAGQ